MSTTFPGFANIEVFEASREIKTGEIKTIFHDNAALNRIFEGETTHVTALHPRGRWEAMVGQLSFSDGADFACLQTWLMR